LGLDSANNDTIGIAFNSYFMATDPIVSNVADIKTTFDILRGYEWALNPDGDINTTSDMPDVINNSWGRTYDPADSAVCGGWINDLFMNLEIAGIVSIHSAGNAGPGAQTVGFPALGNGSPVNNFSVGAVSATDPSFPIASFSSRGPTPCGDTGTLAIKPEVVAPGVNVRSSIREANGTYTYANYQGTSMASPHVSGVALLLREAFPQASATEIKEAIFYTAIDLGDVGEDNTYGRGMIDAVAAYSYLENLYAPQVPIVDTFDLSITGFDIEPNQAVCDVEKLKVYMKNSRECISGEIEFAHGFETGITVYTGLVGSTFSPNDMYELNVTQSFTFETGWNEFYVRLKHTPQWPPYQSSPEADTVNNQRYIRFWVNGQEDLPFRETFDSSHVFESSMYVGNPDERKTWDTAMVEGKYGVSNAAMMNFADYSPRQYQHDYLQTPNLKVNPTNSLTLTFDVSYQLRFAGFADSLIVRVSTDCGDTWSSPVYAKSPDSLNTTTSSYSGPWFPQTSADWRTEIVDLSTFANQQNIMVRIESSNGQGNNLFIDNINIFDDLGPASVKEIQEKLVFLYPNPVHGNTLYFSDSISGSVFSVDGVLLDRFENKKSVDISGYLPGIYLIRNLKNGEVYKFIVA
jgi:bacillopeptidase F